MVKFGVRVRTWDSLPHAKLCKKSLKGIYPFWSKFIPKITCLAILGAVSPHFQSYNGEFWRNGVRTWDSLRHAKLCKKLLKGIGPVGADLCIFYAFFNFFKIIICIFYYKSAPTG